MMFHDRGGEILMEAASTDELRGLTRFIKADHSHPDQGYVIIDDLVTATLPIIDPVDLRERIIAAGFRSLLVVLTRAGHQDMGLGFWSKGAGAFSRDDVFVARRIADHVALAVSHEQLAEAARRSPRRRPARTASRRACNRWPKNFTRRRNMPASSAGPARGWTC